MKRWINKLSTKKLPKKKDAMDFYKDKVINNIYYVWINIISNLLQASTSEVISKVIDKDHEDEIVYTIKQLIAAIDGWIKCGKMDINKITKDDQ